MNSIRVEPRRRIQRWLPAGLLAILGVAIGIAALDFLATHPDPPIWWRFEIGVTAAIAIAVAYSGYWLAQSDYGTGDLWRILGWSVAGVIGAMVIAGGVYVHQAIEQVSIAEPEFLFEFLALAGAAVGLAFGLSRVSLLDRRLETMLGSATPPASDSITTVLSLLDRDSRALGQRWTLLRSLVERTTREVPLKAFVVQLSKEEPFPDDETEVARLVEEEHLPVMVETGLVELLEDRGTVRYVGPESVAEYLTRRTPESCCQGAPGSAARLEPGQ